MLSEVEYLFVFFVEDDSSGEIYIAGKGGIFGEIINIILLIIISFQLLLENLIGCSCISFCRVSILQIQLAIKLIGSRKRALFLFMKDSLHIHKVALTQINISTRSSGILLPAMECQNGWN